MSNRSAHHILNTAANLLGFYLFVITALHITDKGRNSILEGATSVIALLLTGSCVLSIYGHKDKTRRFGNQIGTNGSVFFHIIADRNPVIILIMMVFV